MAEILVFDVNETLLDLQALRPRFVDAFGHGRVMGEWFGLLLRLSLVATVTRTYRPFDVLAEDALAVTARRHHVDLTEAAAAAVLDTMRRLPPHPDAPPALARLQAAGFRLATLTNSAPPVLEDQMRHAGLTPFFEQQLSVDAVQRYKPAPETYRYAARRLGAPVDQLRLVAAHDWDVTGAIRAGARAAFVARPGAALAASAEVPDIVVPDLLALANRLAP